MRIALFFFLLIALIQTEAPIFGEQISDFTFVPLRRQFKTAEEFYSLYRENYYRGTDNLNANIFWLEMALKAPFNSPNLSLAKIENEKQYHAYRVLFQFQIYTLITENYIRLAERYEKPHLYFFNKTFSKEIKEGLEIAKIYYQRAQQALLKVNERMELAWEKRDFVPPSIDGEVEKWMDRVFRLKFKKRSMNYEKELKIRQEKLEIKLKKVEEWNQAN